ncbi:MAG: WXG100 family type VII secretion target [Eubacterium sp.]|nr:WXG100 family type VII secretion target [Eubacterium sp.]
MALTMTLDTEQVKTIATQIESDNNQLKDLLENTKSTIDSLSSVWTGQASEETRVSYEQFANKFFQQYYDILDQYVKFLRTNVADQYEQTETINTRLAGAFK